MILAVAHTTCTVSTETSPQLVPSHNAVSCYLNSLYIIVTKIIFCYKFFPFFCKNVDYIHLFSQTVTWVLATELEPQTSRLSGLKKLRLRRYATIYVFTPTTLSFAINFNLISMNFIGMTILSFFRRNSLKNNLENYFYPICS